MKLTVTGKKMEITDAIKNHLNHKMGKIIKAMGDPADVHIMLAVEKRRYLAEITVKTKGFSVHNKEETDNLYTSIDHALAKIEKQLRKHKERSLSLKVKDHKAESEKLGA